MNFKDIEKIYCLSLKRREDRRVLVSEILNNHSIDFEFFDAIDGEMYHFERKTKWSKAAKSGALGIIQSYIEILTDAKSLGLSNFLIFEDDVELKNTFREDVDVFLNNVPQDWDIIYFGGNHITHFPIPINKHVSRCVSTRATQAVIFRETCYDKVLHRLGSFELPSDETLANMQRFEEVIAYVPVPPLAWQFASYSDIEEDYADYYFLKTWSEDDYIEHRKELYES